MAEFEDKLAAILGNQAAMGQIMALAQSFSGGEGEPSDPTEPPLQRVEPAQETNPLSMLGDLDPKLLQLGMRLLGEYQGDNSQSLALLAAIRPYIRPERYAKLDRAIQLAKLSRVIRVAFQSFGEGADDV